MVSTHSRPKAAALAYKMLAAKIEAFQHTAARRRLPLQPLIDDGRASVSTHSRPKAAAAAKMTAWIVLRVSTHSRPKAAAYTKS